VSDGQTYRYLNGDPLYPFGYGLSYSQFHYSGLTVSPASIKAGQNITVTVNVTNRGPYDADEVGISVFDNVLEFKLKSWCNSFSLGL